MAEEAGAVPEIVKRTPNMTSAILALNTASEILNSARQKFDSKQYTAALSDSKDVMRVASSALLFRDGYVASTLEATIKYLTDTYPGKIPLEKWQRLEATVSGEGPGLLNLLIRLFGKNKTAGKKEAGTALTVADKFLNSVKILMGLGR